MKNQIAILSSLALISCTNIPLQPIPTSQQNSPEVVIFREGHFAGSGMDYVIKLNKLPIATIENDKYIVFRIPEGEHQLSLFANTPLGAYQGRFLKDSRYCFKFTAAGFIPTEYDNDLVPYSCEKINSEIKDKKGNVLN